MFTLNSKLTLVFLLLSLSFTSTSIAQNKDHVSLVKADSTWSTEIIPFPVDWLPDLTFAGFEELRFAPNWKNSEHQEFWTLAMAWQIETTAEMPLKAIHFNFNHYFTELMKPNHWAQEFPDPIIVFEDSDSSTFKGEMTFFDGFHTGKVISVNILGNQAYCETSGKSIIVFRISPKDFNDSIWEELISIVVNDAVCIE